MTQKIITGIFIIIGLISCNNDDDENCHPESVSSSWTLGKEIVVEYNSEYESNDYNVTDGDNRLFEYNHSGAQCDDIADDEWGEKLTFVINQETTDFEFVNEDIVETKCFYQEYGAWVRHNKYQIKDGTIKGEKISENEWKITVSVFTTPIFTDEQPKKIEFTETFSQ
jgi:hypothetical protein